MLIKNQTTIQILGKINSVAQSNGIYFYKIDVGKQLLKVKLDAILDMNTTYGIKGYLKDSLDGFLFIDKYLIDKIDDEN